jgi:crotonobetainyl-CoA:carnitine CoA-transferase CaiB-like acyl-CoA transferase
MQYLPLPAGPLTRAPLLQAAEATKAAAGAAEAVGKHAAESPLTALLWFLVLLLLIACVILSILLYRTETGKVETVQRAVDAARMTWEKQHETDNARLERINEELRKQERKSIEVIAAITQALNANTAVMQGLQFQFVTFETVLSGRPPAYPPLRPPATQL